MAQADEIRPFEILPCPVQCREFAEIRVPVADIVPGIVAGHAQIDVRQAFTGMDRHIHVILVYPVLLVVYY